VLPQAIKNILPALCNEAIAVLKETSIVGLVSVVDLTRAGDLIRSRTMSPYFTLISVAIVYFILVFGLSKAVKRLELRMAQSDRY
jgi:ABC-type amino acid transport system permease subunit